eukprot:12648422-Prorocentrum_lima.AAC.1
MDMARMIAATASHSTLKLGCFFLCLPMMFYTMVLMKLSMARVAVSFHMHHPRARLTKLLAQMISCNNASS